MSSETMQQFLKGAAKTGQFTFEKYFSPLPYEINSPMHNVCVAFIRDYNKICDQVKPADGTQPTMSPSGAAVNIARLHEDTFGDARLSKYEEFTKQFFGNVLSDTPETKKLLSSLNKTYRGSDMPLDTRLMADLLVNGVVRGVTFPFRRVNNFRKELNRRENVATLAAVDSSVRNIAQSGVDTHLATKRMVGGMKGANPVYPTPESLATLGRDVANIRAEVATLHGHMDRALEKGILSSMPVESVDRLVKLNEDLYKARRYLGIAAKDPKLSPEMKVLIDKQIGGINDLFTGEPKFGPNGEIIGYTGGETLKAEIRAQSAFIEFQAKNVEEILRLRLETGETLSKSDIKVLESAHNELHKRMKDLDGAIFRDNGAAAHPQDLKTMEQFKERMGRITEMLSSDKVSKNFMPEGLKEKLNNLIDQKSLDKISDALRKVFAAIGLDPK